MNLTSSLAGAETLIVWIGAVAIIALSLVVVTLFIRKYDIVEHPVAAPLRILRNLVIPSGALLAYLILVKEPPETSTLLRSVETFFGLASVWLLVSAFKVIHLRRVSDGVWAGSVPGLVIDLGRFALGAVGALVVVAAIWHRNLSEFLTTLGIGSIVLGLALQDTLGNLFAGIALLFERPFAVGHWIKVGEIEGEVIETNWRAVRLRSRQSDLVVVPNSVLGKERIYNYSFPTKVHAHLITIGFDYNNPPALVKRVLKETALGTPGILPVPQPIIRVQNFGDSAVIYQLKVFIDNFAALPDTQEELLSRIWYAARRTGLTIPYPIQTVYKTEVPPIPVPDKGPKVRAVLHRVELLAPLSDSEIQLLAEHAVSREYISGEKILSQGDENRSMFVIERGGVKILHREGDRSSTIAELSDGDFFGEMSALTGSLCTSDAAALEDCSVILIPKEAFEAVLKIRPELAAQLANLIESRRQQLNELRASSLGGNGDSQSGARGGGRDGGDLLGKIRKFFSI